MQTERFIKLRKRELEKVFEKDKMVRIWRDIVRDQMRSQDILDLYDCYDLNFNIEERVRTIRTSILRGTYRASSPLIYRLEKKFGICRHMVIPQPIDALVLQTLAEAVIDDVLNNQPSENAFYSRARHNVKKIDDLESYGVTLGELWKDLQKTIYKFSEEKNLIITTDLSNYYDSINTVELQKVFNNYCNAHEVVKDLLFGIVQDISWRPDYLPYANRGIPTTNLEAVRLMAHSFLFEVDEVMKLKSGDCFARWMDDIVMGVNTEKEAKALVSATSDMLKSRGLALNLAKTKFLSQEDVAFNFQFKENEYLTKVTNIAKKTSKGDQRYSALTSELKKKFKKHLKDTRPKYWDKISKRYITCFSILNSEKLLSEITGLYVDQPVLRLNILRYLSTIGYRKSTREKVLEILRNIDVFDDVTLYQVCTLVCEWNVPADEQGKSFLDEFEKQITDLSFSLAKPADFYSVIWFMSKYSPGEKLLDFISIYENLWMSEPFLRRQVTAVLSRLYLVDKIKVRRKLEILIASGDGNTVSLALQILQFIKLESFNPRLGFYLFPQNKPKVYPHSKFLVLCSVLNSKTIRQNTDIQAKVREYITDPYYKKILEGQYSIV